VVSLKRIAIFVDAGYLYAQGSACLQGNKAKRENIKLDHPRFINILKVLAAKVQPSAPLLRIYWYDGTSRGPTLDHRTLADLDDLKLRLGFINSVGQQKGVDSLLVTDLVELSRNGAICDAVLLGGDEDLRIGVQIAQSFGVRVHLIGIEPSRGSQSLQLRQESDTKHEISAVQVTDFLSLLAPTVSAQSIVIAVPQPAISMTVPLPQSPPGAQTGLDLLLDQGIDGVIATIGATGITDIKQALLVSPVIPSIYDRRFLASCRTVLGRDLDMDEKKKMRAKLAAKIKATP
jgi:uncharacterized LabA/DUF88 family protein